MAEHLAPEQHELLAEAVEYAITAFMGAWGEDISGMSPEPFDSAAEAQRLAGTCVAPLVASMMREAAADALREARDAWQLGQWADAPRRADRIEERIANAQYVTDWLSNRLASYTASDQDEEADRG